jgi:hypothetical protein
VNESATAERSQRVYLYIDQLAALTPWSADRIRHMISEGKFIEGVHYFRPAGRRPVFKWKAVERYIEGENSQPIPLKNDQEEIDEETRQARALLN